MFGAPDILTPQHELLLALPFSGYVTLNFDQGLQSAYVRRFQSVPEVIKPQNTYQIGKWTQRETLRPEAPPILQWHGNTGDPETMVFTADDYNRFYAQNEHVSFIKDMCRSQRVLAVGFGFTDPFLTRVLEQTLRTYDSDNRHFAIIGYRGSDPTTPLARRTFTRKYRLNPIFYHVGISEDGTEDHSALNRILEALQLSSEPPGGAEEDDEPYSDSLDFSAADGRREFERDLLTTNTGKQIYVEPRLYKPTVSGGDDDQVLSDTVSIQQIVRSDQSYIISAPHEYGLTSLGKRLFVEINRLKQEVYLRDAVTLPEYRKKLEQDQAFAPPYSGDATLILDNTSFRAHERLLKEIVGTKRFKRLIVLSRTYESAIDGSILYNDQEPVLVNLGNLERADIRAIAEQMYSSNDPDTISGVVEKAYSDLLDLCIPLTPANVVMYISIIYKDGNFVPISRLEIIDKYLRDPLRRPSDPFRDSFNVDNKIDVIAAFVFRLFGEGETTFSSAAWCAFATEYMANTLVSFDEIELLNDLASSRVLTRIVGGYRFNWKLFYSFFLGRHASNRPYVLQSFIASNKHMQLPGLVEVISAMSSDNTNLVEDLCLKLEQAISTFRAAYGMDTVDPISSIEWLHDPEEEKRTWSAVAERLAAGPVETKEIDIVKRSIMAEKRTENQNVVIRDFVASDQDIVRNKGALSDAITNAVDVSGALKVRAINAIFEAYRISYQVGVVLSPFIATNRYFSWNGIAFANHLEYGSDERDNIERQSAIVISAMPRAVCDSATADLGSKRLGEVHRHIALKGSFSDFLGLVNFSLVLRSKPLEWEKTALAIIEGVDRKALYLRYMVGAALHQFHEEVNSNHERAQLKKSNSYKPGKA